MSVSYTYDWRTEDDGTTLVSGKCPVLDLKELTLKEDGTCAWRQAEGYEALTASVKKWNEDRKTTFTADVDEAEAYAKEAISDGNWNEGAYYANETDAAVKRADSAVLSVFFRQYVDLGGAHPGTDYSAVTFDSESGKVLKLSDVASDTDALVKAVTECLQKEYPDIGDGLIVDDLTEGVRETLVGNESSPCWSLTASAMDITFPAYALTTYAYGPEFVSLPFADYPDLFNEAYTMTKEKYFFPVEEGTTTTMSAGQRISWYLETATTEDGIDDPGNYKLHITVNGKEQTFPADLFYSVQAYGLIKNGKTYLYCDGSGDDGWHFLTVYEIREDGAKCISGDQPLSLGFGDVTPMDPENFILLTRSYVCGNEQVGAYYSIGDDGLPAAKTGVWTYIISDENENLTERVLTTKQDVELTKVENAQDYDGAGTKETVKAGTPLTLLTTNSENPGIVEASAILKDAGGTYYRVTVTSDPTESSYIHLVNGVEISDVFDGMTLAG